MITLTKLNEVRFVLNADLIETVEENPDTTVRLTTSRFYIVKESMSEVIEAVVEYRRRIFPDLPGIHQAREGLNQGSE